MPTWIILPYILLCGVVLYFFFIPWHDWVRFCLHLVRRAVPNFSPRIGSIFARRGSSSRLYIPKPYNLAEGDFIYHSSELTPPYVPSKLSSLFLFFQMLPRTPLHSSSKKKVSTSGSHARYLSALFVLWSLQGERQLLISQVTHSGGVGRLGHSSLACQVSLFKFVETGPVTPTSDISSSALKTSWILLPY